jgi:DNA-binding MarR family transcriptional regulator
VPEAARAEAPGGPAGGGGSAPAAALPAAPAPPASSGLPAAPAAPASSGPPAPSAPAAALSPAPGAPSPAPQALPPDPQTPEQELLTAAALTVFRLNGQFLAVADELAKPAGLTAARWQVLGAVLREPLTVSGIARAMGITRQAVQRIADLLVGLGLAEYRPNPAHRRAKLLAATEEGYAAVRRIGPGHAAFSAALAGAVGPDLPDIVAGLRRLTEALDVIAPDADEA